MDLGQVAQEALERGVDLLEKRPLRAVELYAILDQALEGLGSVRAQFVQVRG